MADVKKAKKAASGARPHLSDLFRVGEVVTVADADDNEYQIFVRRPSPLQQEEARTHANGRMGRHKREAADETSDLSIAMVASLQDQTRDELLESRAMFDAPEMREIAFNEVLYDEDIGDDWETDDRYMSALAAISGRMSDITKYNTEMKEAGNEDFIDETQDSQLVELMVEYDLFQEQVDERIDKLKDESSTKRGSMTEEDLREDITKVTIDLEAKMIWYEAFQIKMLFYACRYAHDKKKLYFNEPGEVLEIPQYIRAQLYEAYERLEAGSEDVKNSLSLHSS